ncbi:MAG: hypothetical protein HKN47_14970 [Pirellulaceae bacterium]|nr:hypothetical protein [Pirellulaceae bacterium]
MIVRSAFLSVCVALALIGVGNAFAEVGDPQLKTEHLWYPGELAMSSFDRLFATQQSVYERVTGRQVLTDEDKALASWYWRNLHYAHCQEGVGDYFDRGFAGGQWNREYWHGLFAHGFSLCGTTHSQWSAELDQLLGHCRSRTAGVQGHNSLEVFLTGGAYGGGRWALLDHDVCTVIFDPEGTRLLSIDEIKSGHKRLRDPAYRPDRQRGWPMAGLYRGDIQTLYDQYTNVAYLSGYAGPPPMVHLRAGESLRRYLEPGLDDGKTYVFWGPSGQADVPGPQRDRTWVNQPDKMFGASKDAGSVRGRARFANAVYSYQPRFHDQTYREGVVEETNRSITFSFQTPYVIAATPPGDATWSIYQPGCKNGLRVTASKPMTVSVSTDRGATWSRSYRVDQSADLTDHVKGHQQYWLRIDQNAMSMLDSQFQVTTVCQVNAAVLPRLVSGDNRITYQATHRALVSAGPNLDQATQHVVQGSANDSTIVMEMKSPRGQEVVGVIAASHNQSGNPPNVDLRYRIDYSLDGGQTWHEIVKDWRNENRPPGPSDQWSQSFAYGNKDLSPHTGSVQVRFSNNKRKPYRRTEMHLVYRVEPSSPAEVTFAWSEDGGELRTASRVYDTVKQHADATWRIRTSGKQIDTKWVEIVAR